MHAHKWHHTDNPRGHRAYLHLHTHPDGPTIATASLEANWASGARPGCAALGAYFGGDQDLTLHAAIPHLAQLFVTIGSPPVVRWIRDHTPIQVPMDIDIAHVRWHDGTLWWSFWTDLFGNNPRLPRWRDGRLHLVDLIAGKVEHSKKQIVDRHDEDVPAGALLLEDGENTLVPMPEGPYRARVTFWRYTHRRPRWPWSWFPRVSYSYDLKVLDRPTPDGPKPDPDGRDGYIPIPGKGENAWDCGGDGHFALSGPGRTIARAVGDMVAGVYRDRIRHGGGIDYAAPIT